MSSVDLMRAEAFQSLAEAMEGFGHEGDQLASHMRAQANINRFKDHSENLVKQALSYSKGVKNNG